MSDNDTQKTQFNVFIDLASKFMIPLMVAFIGWQQGEISKLDERIYVIQKESVSEQKLQQTETRILSYIDSRLADLSNKVDLSNQYLHLLLQAQKQAETKK